jgi:RHS repeat-associated protein
VVQSVTTAGVTSRTVYVGLGATGKSLYERTTTPGAPTRHVHFIYAGATHGGSAFALRVLDEGGPMTDRYYSFDHLGSVTAMSDGQGHVASAETSSLDATVLGYDAWGARRNPDGTAVSSASFDIPVGNFEFTGQEQIPNVGLVNMNGRLYDPALGRFLSPDPNVQFATDLQSYNRYSYAGNNPLRYTDPTGYFWKQLGAYFASQFENPITDLELGLTLAVCVGSDGVGCFVLELEFAVFNATVAIGNGAGFDQTLLNTEIGLGVGMATGGLVNAYGGGWLAGLIVGSASAAVTTGISNVISDKSFFGYNVLGAALLSAAEGAAALGLQEVVQVSQASTATSSGQGGSGATDAESRARQQAADTGAAEGRASGVAGERESWFAGHESQRTDAPTPGELLADPDVHEAIQRAWDDSRSDSLVNQSHEEGGWIYADKATGEISAVIRAQPLVSPRCSPS